MLMRDSGAVINTPNCAPKEKVRGACLLRWSFGEAVAKMSPSSWGRGL